MKRKYKIISTLPDGSSPVIVDYYETKKRAIYECEMLAARCKKYLYNVEKV